MEGKVKGDTSILTEGIEEVSFDHVLQKINYFITSTTDGVVTKERILTDYKMRYHYTIDNNGTCSKVNLPRMTEMKQPCVPKGSIKIADSYYGGAANPLDVVTYEYPVSNGLSGYLKVTETDCIPVFQTVHGFTGKDGKTRYMRFVGFTNFTAGIKNTAVFNVPHHCPDADILAMKQTPMGRWRSVFH